MTRCKKQINIKLFYKLYENNANNVIKMTKNKKNRNKCMKASVLYNYLLNKHANTFKIKYFIMGNINTKHKSRALFKNVCK
jgi:hypothetical protein